MFRYLPGILLVQLVTLALFWVNREATVEDLLLRAGLPALIIAFVTALWLSTLGRMEAERRNAELRENHASEREKLNRKIERTRSEVLQQASADKAQMQERAHAERESLVRKTHKQLMQQERSISRRANVKVGLAFMGVTGLGVLMLITEMMTLGLLTITTAGGALGGYVFRWRQSRGALDRLSGAVAEHEDDPSVVPGEFVPAKGTPGRGKAGKKGVLSVIPGEVVGEPAKRKPKNQSSKPSR
jgi:ABC-type multidrug transport system fused ATPase/permease subunit